MFQRIFQSRPGKSNKGSSSLEVVIINSAVISFLIVFVTQGGPFQEALHRTLSSGAFQIEQMGHRMSMSDSDTGPPDQVSSNGPGGTISFAVWYGNNGGFGPTRSTLRGDPGDDPRNGTNPGNGEPGGPNGSGGLGGSGVPE